MPQIHRIFRGIYEEIKKLIYKLIILYDCCYASPPLTHPRLLYVKKTCECVKMCKNPRAPVVVQFTLLTRLLTELASHTTLALKRLIRPRCFWLGPLPDRCADALTRRPAPAGGYVLRHYDRLVLLDEHPVAVRPGGSHPNIPAGRWRPSGDGGPLPSPLDGLGTRCPWHPRPRGLLRYLLRPGPQVVLNPASVTLLNFWISNLKVRVLAAPLDPGSP